MDEPSRRVIETNGIRMHVAEQGSGPLVLLRHGFPESVTCWRKRYRLSEARTGGMMNSTAWKTYTLRERPELEPDFERLAERHRLGDQAGR